VGTERFWRIVWLAAVWHNVIGGLGLIFLGDWIYAREGLPFPVPGVNYVRWWFLILVFAVVYYMVYRDLYNSRALVIASILAKVSSATPDAYYLLFREGVPRIFWVTVGTDYAFAVLFALFLGFLTRQARRAPPPPAVALT
jgi:hypothetical protein